MNKSYEKPRMSLKSRSLVSSDSKRAGKTISCMRNGKVAFGASNNANNSNTTNSTKNNSSEDDKKLNPSTLTMKQEPEEDDGCGYYEENSLIQQTTTTTNTRSSSSSSYPMLTRVRSHSRSLRAMANPSAVWAHFDLCSNDPLRAQCRICGAVVVRGGANPRQCGTTNLHRHLRVHHGGRLVGRRYHVMNELNKRDPEQQQTHSSKALRLATQNIVRQMRNIAPAPVPQQQNVQRHQQQQQQQQQTPPAPAPSQPQQQQQQQQQQSPPSQQQHQPSHRSSKTLVLKTIPLKVKQVSPNTIKIPARQNVQNMQKTLPQTVIPQQPTEVCLRWNSYHSNMQHSFPSLLDSEEFVDVTLACEGRSLKCHKMILSSCSDYLAQLLRENPCQHPIILMKDLKFWEVEALVKFMYRGEVNVTHDKLPQLLNAAEALQVKGLAGPSNTQNPKPPLLIPKTKNTVPYQIPNRISNETKDSKPSTSSNPSTSAPNLISAKRGHKRRSVPSEVPEARPFTKIRLQRPITPQQQQQQRRQRSSSPTMVKLEPIEMPLSPGDHLLYQHPDMMRDEEDSNSNPPTFESIIAMHGEDDPGGDNIELADAGSDLDNNDDSRNNFVEEQMEFVPTDFLDQEQDIVEDPEDQTNCSSLQYTDDDSKHNNEDEDDQDEDDDEDEEEEDDDGEKSEEESRSNRTKKDKT